METNINYVLIVYFIYLPVSLLATWYVSRTLFRNSMVFMSDIFRGRIEIAKSTNHLLRIGFYLLNIGFAMTMLQTDYAVATAEDLFEVASLKVGGFIIYLGCMLFLNLWLFFRGKSKTREHDLRMQMAQMK